MYDFCGSSVVALMLVLPLASLGRRLDTKAVSKARAKLQRANLLPLWDYFRFIMSLAYAGDVTTPPMSRRTVRRHRLHERLRWTLSANCCCRFCAVGEDREEREGEWAWVRQGC